MIKVLKVPYISQWDSVADFSTDDCVPTCAAMLLAFHGKEIPVNEISKKTGKGLVTFEEIKNALSSLGYKIIGTTRRTMDDLKKSIDDGRPFLAIIHYGDLPGRQDTGYSAGHAVVVTGYEEENGKIKTIYTNDPDFWSPRRNEGNNKPYSAEAFQKAWQSQADGNTPCNFWYVDLLIPYSTEIMSYLKLDIATEVEDSYDLKSKDWYSKYWTLEDFIKDSIKAHSQLNVTISDLNKSNAKNNSLNEDIKRFISEINDKTLHIESLQKTNSELSAQLTVMGGQVKEANEQKTLADKARNDYEHKLSEMTTDRDTCKKTVDVLNEQATQKLKGYSWFRRFKSLFGFF